MNIKKYSRWFLLLVLLLMSIKAIIFTGELILVNYFLNSNDKEDAAAFMYRIISCKPVIYHSFRDFQRTLLEDFMVKKAIYAKYRRHENIFEKFNAAAGVKELSFERFNTIYRDNFYFQNMFPTSTTSAMSAKSASQHNWENLDPVSLELLADKTMNSLTLSLWPKVKSAVRPEFTVNLAAYCRWQGNTELADYFEKNADPSLNPYLNCARALSSNPVKNESFNKLLKTIKKNNKLTIEDINEDQSAYEDFNDVGSFKKKWEFSSITGQNPCLRLMGFFAGDGKDIMKPSPRGGVTYKKELLIPKGYYLLSFDYLTVTNSEKPSLYLGKGLSEVYLPPTAAVCWKKIIYILDNSTGEHGIIKPFFRMWGTGTVLIDNMIFAKITKSSFTSKRKALVYISEWQ